MYVGIDAKMNPIWGVLSANVGFDIQTTVYAVCITSGVFLFFLSWMAFASSILKLMGCYLPVCILDNFKIYLVWNFDFRNIRVVTCLRNNCYKDRHRFKIFPHRLLQLGGRTPI